MASLVKIHRFGFCGLDHWVWIPRFGFKGLDSWVWIPWFGFLGLDSRVWIQWFEFQGLDSLVWIPRFGFKGLGSLVDIPALPSVVKYIRGRRADPYGSALPHRIYLTTLGKGMRDHMGRPASAKFGYFPPGWEGGPSW